MRFLFLLSLLLGFAGCSQESKNTPLEDVKETSSLFEQLDPTITGIEFRNDISETKEFNYLMYSYIYNGGGVAAGDINNDGLTDLYFTANQGSNKLYLNRGDFKFEDITESAGVRDDQGWSTGVCMVDLNADGWLDIYVCKSGLTSDSDRENKLYLNNGNSTFTEAAATWGVNDPAYSTMAYFLDFDSDDDLDMYLLNHRTDFRENINVDLEKQKEIDPLTSDKLYRNDGGRFTDITSSAGMENKAWGLAAAVSDFNNDELPDIYVCNDFREPDHLYLNNGDGTFRDGILEHFGHTSFYSMGADVADINHDMYPDLAVLDMVSQDHVRSKRMMASMNPENFRRMVDIGYHHQYMFNMLHLNHGNGDFSNVAHLAGVAKTDWSWAPLFADFDNDGNTDLFITNGIRRDVTDIDYKNYIEQRFKSGNPMSFDEVMENWPAAKVSNYAYRNEGNLRFADESKNWGLDQPVNSNGVAYVDLNNDGTLEIVTNNVDDVAHVYQNHSSGHYLKVSLHGPNNNPFGIGTRVILQSDKMNHIREQYFSRGFQSSIDPVLHFGLGDLQTIQEFTVVWPDGKFQTLKNVATNQRLEVKYSDALDTYERQGPKQFFSKIPSEKTGIDFRHRENEFNDFEREVLLPHKQSTLGPKIAVGDMNGDGLDDFFIGNAHGSAAATYFQEDNGKFMKKNQALWLREADYEDTGALIFDANGDGAPDLYVVSGGNEFSQDNPLLQDRLYWNDGEGNFVEAKNALPKMATSGQAVVAEDIDDDGDLDLFIGGRLIPGAYPFPARSYFLRNDGGQFKDVTTEVAPELSNIGMVTDACFADYDGDGIRDLMVVGEWTPIMAFRKTAGQYLFDRSSEGLEQSNAWWYSINSADMDGDGDIDFVVGNLGLNNKFNPKKEKPLHVFCNDFDGNGTYDIVLSKAKGDSLLPVRGRECSSEQMPFIAQKFPTYRSFAEANLGSIYGPEALSNALHYVAYDFSSIYLENLGNKKFQIRALPIEAQLGPLLATEIVDVNGDGHLDILGVGNKFNSETETARYDSSRGFVLLGDGQGNFRAMDHSGFYYFGNAKDLGVVTIEGVPCGIVAMNDGNVDVLGFSEKKLSP